MTSAFPPPSAPAPRPPSSGAPAAEPTADGACTEPQPSRVLLVALALGLAASVVLALLPGRDALFPALGALCRDIATHDAESLRIAHDGWYARLLPVYAAIEAAQLPPDEPLLLATEGVPPWFVAARFPTRRVFSASPALRAELERDQRPYHVLTLTNAEPLRWSLEPGGTTPR